MPKPPNATPHSDISGVHRDERPNVDTANEAGQDTADLARAERESQGRPPRGQEPAGKDDRS
jgi:hypothetical protein